MKTEAKLCLRFASRRKGKGGNWQLFRSSRAPDRLSPCSLDGRQTELCLDDKRMYIDIPENKMKLY